MRRVMVSVMVCVLCALSSSADAAVTLFFDDKGSLLPGRPARQAGLLSAGAAQRSVPRGINLPPDASYTFYPVTGKTFSDVVQSARENAPGRRGAAGLAWSVGLSFDYDASSEINEEDETVHVMLKVRGVRIDYVITVTLPMLLDNTELNPVERDLWRGYVRDLVEGERIKIRAMKDSAILESTEEALDEITYVIFDPAPAVDAEQAVASFMREEGIRIGREMMQSLRRQLQESGRKAPSSPREQTAPADEDAGSDMGTVDQE